LTRFKEPSDETGEGISISSMVRFVPAVSLDIARCRTMYSDEDIIFGERDSLKR